MDPWCAFVPSIGVKVVNFDSFSDRVDEITIPVGWNVCYIARRAIEFCYGHYLRFGTTALSRCRRRSKSVIWNQQFDNMAICLLKSCERTLLGACNRIINIFCPLKVCSPKVCSLKVCSLEVCFPKVCFPKVCSLKVCSAKVCLLEVCRLKVSSLEV